MTTTAVNTPTPHQSTMPSSSSSCKIEDTTIRLADGGGAHKHFTGAKSKSGNHLSGPGGVRKAKSYVVCIIYINIELLT
jgi:hypothetical protein